MLGSGADLWVIHTNNKNRWTVTDTKGFGFYQPVPDKVQDVVLHNVSYSGSQRLWKAVLSRKMKTCDHDNDIAVDPGRTNYMMWAFGQAFGQGYSAAAAEPEAPPTEEQIDIIAKKLRDQMWTYQNKEKCREDGAVGHLQCKSANTNVLAVAAADIGSGGNHTSNGNDTNSGNSTTSFIPDIIDNGDGTFTMDVLCAVSEIPARETTYMNCYLELPSDQQYKITEFTTIFGHKTLVHHGLVYGCLKEVDEAKVQHRLHTNGSGPYDQADLKMLCQAFYLVGQAPNDPTYKFPPDAGLVFGKNSYRYVAVETHYNNPQGLVGESDPGTGLRIKFEPATVRPHGVGILTIGQFLMELPPGQRVVKANVSFCSSACTKRFKQPVVMIGQFLHMHGAGRQVLTKRIRNGREIEPLVTVHNFDYNYQSWLGIPQASNILRPGDELSVQCVFDTTSRSNTTTFGLSTQEEMCFHWIYYYPAQEGMGICSSLGDAPLTMCSDSIDTLLDLQVGYSGCDADVQIDVQQLNSMDLTPN
eukprot:gene8979-9151_t